MCVAVVVSCTVVSQNKGLKQMAMRIPPSFVVLMDLIKNWIRRHAKSNKNENDVRITGWAVSYFLFALTCLLLICLCMSRRQESDNASFCRERGGFMTFWSHRRIATRVEGNEMRNLAR